MLNIDDCRKILNRKKNKFTEEEIKKIREYLYKMAKIVVEAKIQEENEK